MRVLLFRYDPKVPSEQIECDINSNISGNTNGLDEKRSFEVKKSPYEAAQKAHAIVVCTEWDEFKDYDYSKIYENMEKPAFIFDGRKILDHEKLMRIGFRVETVGKNLNHVNNHNLV